MVERVLTVIGQLGLHARAAAKLVRVAAQFQSSIKLERVDTGHSADAKSILNVLMLAASSGTSLRAIAVGPDEAAALDASTHSSARALAKRKRSSNHFRIRRRARSCAGKGWEFRKAS